MMRIPDVGSPLGEPEITTPREPEITSPETDLPSPRREPKPERKDDRTTSH